MSATPASAPIPAFVDGTILFADHRRWIPHTERHWPAEPIRWSLRFTVSGQGIYTEGDSTLTSRPGVLAVMRQGSTVTHTVTPGDSHEFFVIHFEPRQPWEPPAPFNVITESLRWTRVSSMSTRQRVHDAVARIAADMRRCTSADALAAMTATGAPSGRARRRPDHELRHRLMLLALNEVFVLAAQDPHDVPQLDPRIAAALEMIRADLGAVHTVESLARHTNLSPSRFAHLFTEQIGVSPRRAQRQIQLQEAMLRLRYTDEAIGAIARQTGFASNFDFSRQFRRRYGTSPRDFRRSGRTLKQADP